MPHKTIAILLGAASILVPVFAQGTQRTTGLLPPDSPELYHTFLHFHEGLSVVLEDRKAQDPVVGAKVAKGVARDYGISVEDLDKVTAVAHSLATSLTSWQSDVKLRADQARAKGERPDAAEMQRLAESRRQLIEAARQRLSSDLSAESWAALHAYINNVHRQNVTVLGYKPAATQGQPQ